MDRRSWLWRRKSLEKSPGGETESSGSASSHSERFSDDQTVSNVNVQSPEVTSKVAPGDEQELDATLKTLSEKLSEALLNIRAKEELVNQHAKVAEEAVSGWERAENEVVVLKKQNDTLTQKNLILEDRIGNLDGALRECFRQLRQAREEQEEKIYDAIAKKSEESETKKAELENQLVELQNQLQNTTTEADNQMLADAISKLEAAEKENSILKLKLISKMDELELMIRERDLTVRAAETASKQHLDSIKKVAKLEAECRRLKAMARKAVTSNDYRPTTPSVYVESFTDSQSDCAESALFIGNDSGKLESFDKEQCKPDLVQCTAVSSFGINMMDDFLEMEKLAALPETHGGGNPSNGGQIASRDEMEALVNHVAELEDNLKKTSTEKTNLETALDECQMQLQASRSQCKQTEVELADLKTQLALVNKAREELEEEAEHAKIKLETSANLLDKAEANLLRIQDQLEEAKHAVEDSNRRKEKAEFQLKEMELELDSLKSTTCALKKEVEKERNSSRETAAKRDELEAEITKLKLNYHSQSSTIYHGFNIKQDEELAVAARKFAACQETIASLGRQLKSLATLEDLLMESEGGEDEAVPSPAPASGILS